MRFIKKSKCLLCPATATVGDTSTHTAYIEILSFVGTESYKDFFKVIDLHICTHIHSHPFYQHIIGALWHFETYAVHNNYTTLIAGICASIYRYALVLLCKLLQGEYSQARMHEFCDCNSPLLYNFTNYFNHQEIAKEWMALGGVPHWAKQWNFLKDEGIYKHLRE